MSTRWVRPIAIVLPQFHPIPENDEWWGAGFTEWRNVVKARPRFPHHYQPHLPADLGFYDLRLRETRQMQAELARRFGIHGFCYYHYWFNGKRVLEQPVEDMLVSGQPDFPFMLCWANENWTRVWDGSEDSILLRQDYSADDDRRHLHALLPYFRDPRYIRVDGRPVFAIYKDGHIPDVRRMVETFREEAMKEGVDLYLCRFDVHKDSRPEAPEELGFDAAIEFQPLSTSYRTYLRRSAYLRLPKFAQLHLYPKFVFNRLLRLGVTTCHSFDDFVTYDLKAELPSYLRFPGVSPGWDNTPRRGWRATVFRGSSPTTFGRWAREKLKQVPVAAPDENLFFINAWNEWAEGNHLEPCERWGLQYLSAFRAALDEAGVSVPMAGDESV